MSQKVHPMQVLQSRQTLSRLVVTFSVLSAVGLVLWGWILQQPEILPAPNSKSGKALLYQYLGTSHDVWLILLALTLGYLMLRIYKSRRKESLYNQEMLKGPLESTVRFIRKNPITSLLFIAYTIAMIWGTTYLYADMFGWYAGLLKGHFLDNFSIRGAFISETMRRSDYRIFPLAHQDLHILSWFSIHIKTWMLFSAAELIGIVLLSIKFLNGLQPEKLARQSTLLLIASLLLIHPSTGTAFFHVIYSERLLCFVFMLYLTSYLDYRNSGKLSSFYLAFLWALIGIYLKDIAILLFVVPPAFLWIVDLKYQRLGQQDQKDHAASKLSHQLEKWLCSLMLIFVASYIFLSLIPSSYADKGAYNEGASFVFIPDLRLYVFAVIVILRIIAVLTRRIEFNLLDAINFSAIAYIVALAYTYELDANSYLSLPIQLIASINIGWVWIRLVEVSKQKYFRQKGRKIMAAVLASFLIISLDHLTAKSTFVGEILEQKSEQAFIQATYEKLHEISEDIRETGDDVNIIINQKSKFEADRYLNRIPYKSLIEYKSKSNTGLFVVEDGAGKGKAYSRQVGDLVVNIDKGIELVDPLLEGAKAELLYRHRASERRTGIIFRITGLD
jgi:hypothetical protein